MMTGGGLKPVARGGGDLGQEENSVHEGSQGWGQRARHRRNPTRVTREPQTRIRRRIVAGKARSRLNRLFSALVRRTTSEMTGERQGRGRRAREGRSMSTPDPGKEPGKRSQTCRFSQVQEGTGRISVGHTQCWSAARRRPQNAMRRTKRLIDTHSGRSLIATARGLALVNGRKAKRTQNHDQRVILREGVGVWPGWQRSRNGRKRTRG